MIKFAKILGVVVAATALLLGAAYQFRTDPVAIISGKRLTGPEQPYPEDWLFSNEYMTIAVEVRPDDPHSVTTLCFVHEGVLYVPAQSGSTKDWTHYVLDDPRVRIKVGAEVYPARASRVLNVSPEEVASYAVSKYPQLADRDPSEMPQDVWLFRISQR